MPPRPDYYDLLGISWQGPCYYDRCMPMACSSSCKTFEICSTVLEWIAQSKLHIHCILHLLDDLLITPPSNESCQGQLDTFLRLRSCLGVPMAPEKTGRPSNNWLRPASILIPQRFFIISNLAIGIILSAAFYPETIFHSYLPPCLATFLWVLLFSFSLSFHFSSHFPLP